MDGGGGGSLGPSLPLVDGGGSVRGWLLMAICGGCWWVVVVLVQACRWCWALLVVCGWCCWVLDIGCCWFLVIVVVCHCASFIGVVIVWRHFISCGDVSADMSVGLLIEEG